MLCSTLMKSRGNLLLILILCKKLHIFCVYLILVKYEKITGIAINFVIVMIDYIYQLEISTHTRINFCFKIVDKISSFCNVCSFHKLGAVYFHNCALQFSI